MSQLIASKYIDRLQDGLGGPQAQLPNVVTAATILQHGGFQILSKPGRLAARLKKHVIGASQAEAMEAALAMQNVAETFFFQKLCPNVFYGIPAQLMSHLTFPHEGRTYTEPTTPETENPTIAAVFTFVGQFVDHDLTFNGLNLFDVQTNTTSQPEPVVGGDTKKVVPDFSSPAIDLDSVYGRHYPPSTTDPSLKSLLDFEGMKYIFCGCRFRLRKLAANAYDLPRWTDASVPDRVGAAWIFDPRNDENQLVLHIHILLMRVHNKLVDQMLGTPYPAACQDLTQAVMPTPEDLQCIAEIRKKVVCIWQSVLLNEFLPLICDNTVLSRVRAPGYVFHYKPDANGVLKMPHEFAIGYRFGHSMLRSSYQFNGSGEIPLFDNRNLLHKGDLRGGRPLTLDHVVDWSIFYPQNTAAAPRSLKIDSHVTFPVFDLPESAIPDDIKTEGNLAKRNLDRSRSIELGCGEDVAKCMGIKDILTPIEVEPATDTHPLFQQDVNTYQLKNGAKALVDEEPFIGFKDTYFKTPLWYYILREAELRNSGEFLGELGSTIVAEVIVQGIVNGTYKYDCGDEVILNGKRGDQIKLRDLIDFVHD